mmetsp:Transcript_16948/g.12118  ORF Transcript_16948/g.12118 Transcript_16948/m.12118 type:complete len:89 (+) Transcript_16948:240-506(+)
MVMMGVSFILYCVASFTMNKTLFFSILVLSRIISGACSASIQTTCYACSSKLYPERREELLGYLGSAEGVGMIVGPIVGAAVYSAVGF